MRRLGTVIGVALLALGSGVSTGAWADHLPGEPVVEGDASYKVLDDGAGSTVTLLYSCRALTTGQSVASTVVRCEVRQGDPAVVKDSTGLGQESNAVVTPPRVVEIDDAPFEICWEAWAWDKHGRQVHDVTEPNCIQGEVAS